MLRGEYSALLELKTRHCRVFAFQQANIWYIVSAATKKKSKVQEHDYRYALSLRDDFYARL